MKGAADDRAIANPFLALVQYLKKQEQQQKDQRKRRLFSFFSGPEPATPKIEPASGFFQSA